MLRYVTKEIEKCRVLGIPLRTRSTVKHIICDESGRVQGLEVRTGYRFPNKDSIKTKFIKTTKDVILRYGGFSSDVKFRIFQDSKLNAILDSINQSGATSEL